MGNLQGGRICISVCSPSVCTGPKIKLLGEYIIIQNNSFMISQLLKGAISHSAFFVFHLAIKGIVGHINSNEELKRAPVCLTRALVGTNSQMVGPKKKKEIYQGSLIALQK